MKKNNIFKWIIPLLIIAGLNSCKDSIPQPDFTKDTPIVELPAASLAGNGGGNSMAAAFTVTNTPADDYIYVNYAAADANSKDVVTTLAVDTATLGKFNRANGSSYPVLPAAGYTLPSNKITIPNGQRKVQYHFKINTSVLDPTQVYALPFKITDASGYTISGNFGTLVIIISLKNKWDGVYTVTGTMTDVTTSSLTGNYPHTIKLVTQGPTTVAVYDDANGTFAHSILSGGSVTSYGTFSPIFTIDPTTNKITGTTNYYGQPTPGNGRSALLDATGVNAFTMSADGNTPVSMKVKYILNQNGSDRTFFDETWTYTGSR